MNPSMGPGSRPPQLRGIDGGRSGDGGDMDKLTSRVESLERSMLQASMDLSYIKGRIEDAPTKDWINEKLGRNAAIILGAMGLGLTVIGFLIVK